MRNPKRIKKMCALLEEVWSLHPDWRMGQVVSNLQGPGPHDVFFMEDDDWEKAMLMALDRPTYEVGKPWV